MREAVVEGLSKQLVPLIGLLSGHVSGLRSEPAP
jgi:hypothetical protein